MDVGRENGSMGGVKYVHRVMKFNRRKKRGALLCGVAAGRVWLTNRAVNCPLCAQIIKVMVDQWMDYYKEDEEADKSIENVLAMFEEPRP